jgi:hypothetical protein
MYQQQEITIPLNFKIAKDSFAELHYLLPHSGRAICNARNRLYSFAPTLSAFRTHHEKQQFGILPFLASESLHSISGPQAAKKDNGIRHQTRSNHNGSLQYPLSLPGSSHYC